MASLRARLILASLISMSVVAGMGLANMSAAYAARDSVLAARRSYERVALYTRLDYAAAEYESLALSTLSAPVKGREAVHAARARFVALLDRAAAAVSADPAEESAHAGIVAEGRAALASLGEFDGAMARFDAIDRVSGSRGVGAAVARIRRPYEIFHRDLGAWIAQGDTRMAAATDKAIALNKALTRAALIGLGVILVMMAAVTLPLLRRLKTGLERLDRGARAVGAGALSHRIALGGGDELAAVSDAFDAMAGELQRQQAALRAANSNLETAVAERTTDLSRANAALAEEDRRRRTFLADVGHELRTPLTIIRGEAQLALRATDPDTVDHAPVYGRILDQTHDLERLVNDLFLIARAESGGLKLHRRDTDLGDLTRRVASDFEALAAEERATILASPSPVIEAQVDPDRVRQMMAALIDNALRHTRPGVRIEIGAEIWRGAPLITVSDDGPGVAPEVAETLFTRFRRGDEARGQGSGLGLAVVRALAEAHGGSAGLENRPGGGVRAWLRFPAVQGGA